MVEGGLMLGQTVSQAPQVIHKDSSVTILTKPLWSIMCDSAFLRQTSIHTPHPVQSEGLGKLCIVLILIILLKMFPIRLGHFNLSMIKCILVITN